jgi:hypothetical protein
VFAQSLQALDVDDDDSALEDGVKSTDHTNRGAHSPMDDDDDDDEEVTITLQRTSSYTGLTGVVLNNSLVNDGGGTVLDTIFMSKKPVEKKKFKKSRFSLALPRGLQRKLDAVNNGKYNGGNLTNVSEGRGGHPFLRPLSGNKEEGKAVDEANTLILEELSSDDDSGGIPGQV